MNKREKVREGKINGCGTAPGKLVCDLSFTDHELGAGKHRELLTILPPTWELIII